MNKSDVEIQYYFSGIPTSNFEVFTFIYGIIFINLYDCLFPRFLGYHFFLLIVYVAPYIPLMAMRRIDIFNLIWLGVLISLCNDIFFFFIAKAVGKKECSIVWYYSNWLIPQGTYLGRWDFLFFKLDVYSWIMALSIYARVVFLIIARSWRPKKT